MKYYREDFQKIIVFPLTIFSRLNLRISLLKTLKFLFSKYLSLSFLANTVSFSITISDLGFLFKISFVKAPVPGQISIT